MAQHALKEWAVTIAALAAGDQVLIVRKGGIHEKRFELPHPRFYLLPGHEHQRPELIKPEWRERFADPLARRDEPSRIPLAVFAEIHAAHPIADPDALAAIHPLHILTEDYAQERLRWRRKHPLWAVVLRVSRVPEPPVLAAGPELAGCTSWVDLPDSVPAPAGAVPVLDDDAFADAANAVEAALAACATPQGGAA
ncbi:MAG: DUF1802 family protein [Thermoleophilia bacterium]